MRKKPLRKRHIVIGSVLVLVLGLGSTAAWALDRFVIEHVEISDVAQYEADNSTSTTSTEPTAAATTEPVLTDTSYTSDDANVTISTVVTGSGAETVTYYVADVELTDATALRSAFAQNSFGENIIDLTSSIAAEHNAIFAINGDYYGFRDTGIVIRNGVTYRDEPARDGLAFYLDGSVEVYDETTTSADELIADGVWNTLSFGPAIVEDGDVVAGIENVEIDTNFGNHSVQGEQPRTAVGVIDDNHLVFVVVDGRDPGYSSGVTLPDLAVIMQDLGATTAYNLDGGGSSTMYFNGTVINQPSNGGERETSDILYVGAAS
ncbi:phosphodiester glycosidase family protein [Salinibacterium sp. SWN139]|uniref:phosphodiester glycosidase family protein n=1 Tax=Salinibacterium sp. SWN139 TaxID=2792055 RepID=UPI0018CD0359|nr:phosphodiester glycosidase family protein [Salinibacterium sp. SWN139]MBH0053867.1 phosphodiester glycosidase family protein [Salinibacterium sp. SWN139]